MAVIRPVGGTISDDIYNDVAQPEEARAAGVRPVSRSTIRDFICPKKQCDVCGDYLWAGPFIMWRGETTIAICEKCAEHTINGLSRDVCELLGRTKRKVEPAERYGARWLTERVGHLQDTNLKYAKQILDLERALMQK